MRRGVSIGCLVLLMIPVVLVAYFWFTVWDAGRENERREQAAFDSLLRRAHEAADRTADALTRSRDTGTDALMGVIWEHTGSPVISYDEERRAFTAVADRSVVVEREPVLLVGGPVMVKRCFTYTYVRRSGAEWTSKITERGPEACRASGSIGDAVRFARVRMGDMEAASLTRAGLQRVLDPGGLPRDESRFDVRSVERAGRTVVALVLARDVDRYGTRGDDEPVVVGQCYRLTRIVDPDGGVVRPVTAAPVVAAAC
ncbi:hypothetical protein [Streptomyces griseoloalbus]|uniref:Uncharacterized protein n=1 Tax=Streptomyces griseoloalbus TaxID=67303 RepID=A0A7W8F510_9ACTN|nr:hypothetical protein [Streptomyces albaduncus]MBB5123438.1 hypothetical protein [Streptomyces albaduncus]GGW52204.1 hypothetical protein GCM10010340_33440 [Streptomyces albaduncus]